ncbi:molybdopterin synthase small subunit [Psychromonas sp. PRT-SC03]|nr:molybdopterin synthase small subunit [Psychromonas sp. PRT-SC03]
MIKVLFFAQLREQLGVDTLNVSYQENMSVAMLLDQLKTENMHWQKILSSNTLMIAVNQNMSTLSSLLQSGDEVAFFPPVTGG